MAVLNKLKEEPQKTQECTAGKDMDDSLADICMGLFQFVISGLAACEMKEKGYFGDNLFIFGERFFTE